ncbi:hypothetical protein [Geothrix sp. 21YS21S-4]|uniref:hypothetical protein n=1 Tax=Geothrix sp. 21YS21S-4 TaxID=3068889 RepID=UPI0027BA41C1|nr:hypothetical protein [Geothrix sp. 21YS21S-4]
MRRIAAFLFGLTSLFGGIECTHFEWKGVRYSITYLGEQCPHSGFFTYKPSKGDIVKIQDCTSQLVSDGRMLPIDGFKLLARLLSNNNFKKRGLFFAREPSDRETYSLALFTFIKIEDIVRHATHKPDLYIDDAEKQLIGFGIMNARGTDEELFKKKILSRDDFKKFISVVKNMEEKIKTDDRFDRFENRSIAPLTEVASKNLCPLKVLP